VRHQRIWLLLLIPLAACNRVPEEQTRARLERPEVLGRAILDELNSARAEPEIYAKRLESRRPFYKDTVLELPGHTPLQTREGAAALDEAVNELEDMDPIPALIWSDALTRAAREFGKDIGPKGLVTHTASDGSTPADRIRRYVPAANITGEAISFGPADPESVIADLLVDDGVPGRGHRKILTNPQYRFAGVACGAHSRYRTMCVIDLADQRGATR